VYIKSKRLTQSDKNYLSFYSNRKKDTFINLINRFKSYANTIRSFIPEHFVKEILVYKPSKSSSRSYKDSCLFWKNVQIEEASLENVIFNNLNNKLQEKRFSEQRSLGNRSLEQRSLGNRSLEQRYR